jgi:TonB family protein
MRRLVLVVLAALTSRLLQAQVVRAGMAQVRFAWTAVNVIVTPTDSDGVRIWIVTSGIPSRRPSTPFRDSDKLPPSEVMTWAESVHPFVDAAAPNGTDSAAWDHPPVLIASDSLMLTLGRRRNGSKWDPDAYLYLYSAIGHKAPESLVVRLDRALASAFVDTLRALAIRSRWVPHTDSVPQGAQVGALQEPPEMLVGIPPVYPSSLRNRGIEGEVYLTFVIDTAGVPEPTSFHVVLSDDSLFSAAAEAALKKGRFRPALVNGIPKRVLVQMPITFALRR